MTIGPLVTREDLANLTGSSLYTASRVLSAWETDGLIVSRRGRLRLLNVARLRRSLVDQCRPLPRVIAPPQRRLRTSRGSVRTGNAVAAPDRGARLQARPMTTSESDLTESPCPSEWRSRSLARLVAHLSDRYRSPAELCLDALSDLFVRPGWTGKQSEPLYERAIEAFTTLEQQVRMHMTLEDNRLIPLVLAIEHPELVSVRRSRAECEELVTKALDDHQRIGRSINMLEGSIRPLARVRSSSRRSSA